MDVENRPIGKVKPYAGNPRTITAEAVSQVAESIRRFGFRQPIVVDAKGVIVAGHTRWLAAKELKLKVVPVHVAKDLTPEQVRAYRLADNRTGEIAEWDDAKLVDELLGLAAGGTPADVPGVSQAEIAALIQESEPAPPPPEVAISPELFERHDYLVVYFDNDFDWQVAIEALGIETVVCRPNNKSTIVQKGTGRVIPAARLLALLGKGAAK